MGEKKKGVLDMTRNRAVGNSISILVKTLWYVFMLPAFKCKCREVQVPGVSEEKE